MWLAILFILIALTHTIYEVRRRIICNKAFLNFTIDNSSINVDIRYLHPTDAEQSLSIQQAKLYIQETGFVLIPDMSYIFCPDIFLFVKYKIHADRFPKPIFLCVINDFRLTKESVIIKSSVKTILFETNSTFEMIIETNENIELQEKLKAFFTEEH